MRKTNFKLKFDKEYSTGYYKEYAFLKERDIKYTFVKVVDNVTTWKYEKTPELFLALADFYRK